VGGSIRKKVNNFKGETLNDIICDGNSLSCNGVFIRKDVILKNQFNENRILSASEDYDLWIRLAARFPLHYSNEVTSLIIDHDARSVRAMDPQKIIQRIQLLINTIHADTTVTKVFARDLHKIQLVTDLYIAIHTAPIPKFKIISIKYLIKTIFTDISILKNKAFYASIKNIIIKW
jgi:hypothetical protein